ncbi:YfaP family protein [Sorangium sp. So ce861]|uniref:YfaP family protein n=1 Tax=Sorangium sp. So ce861 TaxID=3133323 RepID=UPI003F60AAF3
MGTPHRRTASGGEITQDVTQGYGPEMYVLPRAPEGRYLIRAHYYASDRNRASARTKVHAAIIEDYGTPQQRMFDRVVTLQQGKDMHDLLQVTRADRKAAVAR